MTKLWIAYKYTARSFEDCNEHILGIYDSEEKAKKKAEKSLEKESLRRGAEIKWDNLSHASLRTKDGYKYEEPSAWVWFTYLNEDIEE